MLDTQCPSMAEKTDKRSLTIRDLGLAEYREVLAIQEKLNEQRRAGDIGDTVLIVEHPPVITLGARQSANKLLIGAEMLARREIEFVQIRRGGGATVHNPGQLVFYPILNVQQLGLGINEYIRALEAIGIDLLEHEGLACQRREGYPGLWIDDRKIASIGVRVSRFVTRHGMAINIANDLSLFGLMVPCGLDGVEMTSVEKETGRDADMEAIKKRLVALLRRHFERCQP